jgi:hypothetical protein
LLAIQLPELMYGHHLAKLMRERTWSDRPLPWA